VGWSQEEDPITGMSVKLHPHEGGSGEAWIYAKVFGQIGAAVELVLYPSHIARVLYTFPDGNKCGDDPYEMEVGPNKDYKPDHKMVCGQSASLCQDGEATDQPNLADYTRVPALEDEPNYFDLLNPSQDALDAIAQTAEGDIVRYWKNLPYPDGAGHWATVCNEYHEVWSATSLANPYPGSLKYFEVEDILDTWNPDDYLKYFIIWKKP